MKKLVSLILAVMMVGIMCSCSDIASSITQTGTQQNVNDTKEVTNKLTARQPSPTDIDYSLERYNLTRRAYWVNGQRERANTLVCEVDKPLGYIVLFTESGAVVGRFIVDGKVSSLNSFLSPDYVERDYGNSSAGYTTINTELADIDGSYGENDNGIFFFTPDGKYVEWTGIYLYSDIPFELGTPTVLLQEVE